MSDEELWTEAAEEAYASAPDDEVVLFTLEFRHSTFEDDEGDPTAIRVVINTENLVTTLEPEAPMNGGEEVEFIACHFGCVPPASDSDKIPEIDIWIDNVSRELSKHLEAASLSREPIEMSYREFLASDSSGPQYVIHGMTLREVTADVHRCSGKAAFYDLMNRAWLSDVYRPEDFPGLMRQ